MLPDELLQTDFVDMNQAGLMLEDLDPTKGPRQASLKRIIQASHFDKYRAARLPPPTAYRNYLQVIMYTSRHPEAPRGNKANIGPNLEPIRVLSSSMHNLRLTTDNQGYQGIAVIPAMIHNNYCSCPAAYALNNKEYLQPLRMCLPYELSIGNYQEDPTLPNYYNMGLAAPVYENPSNVYFSYISESGTVLNQLIRRQPRASVQRGPIIFYHPQFSHINIKNSKTLLTSINANLNRQEASYFTMEFGKTTTMNEQGRFPPLTELHNNVDVIGYGESITSLEDIIINEPLVNMFHGRQSCPYCNNIIQVFTENDLLYHFMKNHSQLQHGYFTCPGCLIPEAYSAKKYLEHYRYCHGQAAGLMMVLSETGGNARAQQAHILNMILQMTSFWPQKQIPAEKTTYISHLGGWTNGNEKDAAEMVLDIHEYRLRYLPGSLAEHDRTQKQASPILPRRRNRSHSSEAKESQPIKKNAPSTSRSSPTTFANETIKALSNALETDPEAASIIFKHLSRTFHPKKGKKSMDKPKKTGKSKRTPTPSSSSTTSTSDSETEKEEEEATREQDISKPKSRNTSRSPKKYRN